MGHPMLAGLFGQASPSRTVRALRFWEQSDTCFAASPHRVDGESTGLKLTRC